MIKTTGRFRNIYLLSGRFTSTGVVCTSEVELLRVLAKFKKYSLLQFPNVYNPEVSQGKTKLVKVTKKELTLILKRNKSKIPKSSFEFIKRML